MIQPVFELTEIWYHGQRSGKWRKGFGTPPDWHGEKNDMLGKVAKNEHARFVQIMFVVDCNHALLTGESHQMGLVAVAGPVIIKKDAAWAPPPEPHPHPTTRGMGDDLPSWLLSAATTPIPFAIYLLELQSNSHNSSLPFMPLNSAERPCCSHHPHAVPISPCRPSR